MEGKVRRGSSVRSCKKKMWGGGVRKAAADVLLQCNGRDLGIGLEVRRSGEGLQLAYWFPCPAQMFPVSAYWYLRLGYWGIFGEGK